jgi:hypothetical protein
MYIYIYFLVLRYVFHFVYSLLTNQSAMEIFQTSVIVSIDRNGVILPMKINMGSGEEMDAAPEFPYDLKMRLLSSFRLLAPKPLYTGHRKTASIPPRASVVSSNDPSSNPVVPDNNNNNNSSTSDAAGRHGRHTAGGGDDRLRSVSDSVVGSEASGSGSGSGLLLGLDETSFEVTFLEGRIGLELEARALRSRSVSDVPAVEVAAALELAEEDRYPLSPVVKGFVR